MTQVSQGRGAVERWLEAERDRLPLWLPVMVGAGIALWFVLPGPDAWLAAGLAALALACAAAAMASGGRASHAVMVGGLALAGGVALAALRAERVAAPVLARPAMLRFVAEVEQVEALPARELVRLTLRPRGPGTDTRGRTMRLPARVRVNLPATEMPERAGPGAVLRLAARLVPPPPAAVPGAYDFARAAWFAGIGATGRGHAPVALLVPAPAGGALRGRLSAHITDRLPGSAGGIASALATGDTGAIAEEDAAAMRAAGLAHLLSVSGLHITAVVAATMLVVLRTLSLVPWLALRWRLPLVAAAAGATAAVGYTLLTGAAVPTIRSCVAALLVLAALAMGREAMTLRLVAVGALVVMIAWPEAVAGPSFQLSFAAITAIVALHEHPRVRGWAERREEGPVRKLARGTAMLLVTGIAVEAALMPIAVYHFHRAGLYGALANIVAIPWTTFVVMPLEAAALLLDAFGLGTPIWWLAGHAIAALLWLARIVAASPGAVAAWPSMPGGAIALIVAGGLWLTLWQTRVRSWGLVPLAIGGAWAWSVPPPDLLVTGDGRHAAVRTADGGIAILRERAGDYIREVLAAGGGVDVPGPIDGTHEARCSRDLCLATVAGGWRVAMTRSGVMLPAAQLTALCAQVDIVVSERRLPRRCTPRWLKLDRDMLERTGGVAVTFATRRVARVREAGDRHPWIDPPRLGER